jgi:ABC-type Zn uptake system ZnuABC Zn-binding protein ZnuA
MSIRAIARDLYRVKQELERLADALTQASPDRRPGIEERLRQAKSEYDYLQRALNGKIGR